MLDVRSEAWAVNLFSYYPECSLLCDDITYNGLGQDREISSKFPEGKRITNGASVWKWLFLFPRCLYLLVKVFIRKTPKTRDFLFYMGLAALFPD